MYSNTQQSEMLQSNAQTYVMNKSKMHENTAKMWKYETFFLNIDSTYVSFSSTLKAGECTKEDWKTFFSTLKYT